MVEKLSFAEKSGYALGDMAANFVFQAMLALQLDFYTHTFGLTAAQAGTLFLVVGLGVACLNPIMGMIADRTSTKWGKFRPWLLWTAVPFGVIGVLTFTTPNISPAGKLIYAWITYILLRIIYTVNNVPYASLTAVMTSDPDERTSIASYVVLVATEVLRQFAYGLSGPIIWAMMGDVADYGEWKTGRRASGTVTSAVVFALWAGLALGGAIAGWLFSFYGYVSAAQVQSAHAQSGILLTASIYAGVAFFAVAACLFFYPITQEVNRKIADELAERRKKFASGKF